MQTPPLRSPRICAGVPTSPRCWCSTPEQGLAEFRQLAGFGDALDVLQDNPLPSVLVVTPRRAGRCG